MLQRIAQVRFEVKSARGMPFSEASLLFALSGFQLARFYSIIFDDQRERIAMDTGDVHSRPDLAQIA